MAPRSSTVQRVIISPYQIHYLCFILEAYEGIAVVTTLKPELGLVQLNIAPGCEGDVGKILEAEKDRLQLRTVHCTADSTI